MRLCIYALLELNSISSAKSWISCALPLRTYNGPEKRDRLRICNAFFKVRSYGTSYQSFGYVHSSGIESHIFIFGLLMLRLNAVALW